MSFLHTLKQNERDMLRQVVKKVHLCYHPEQFCTDREADKVITTLGPEVVEFMIKFAVDKKIDLI